MGYSQALFNLSKLPQDAFEAIPEFDHARANRVLSQVQVMDDSVKAKEQTWVYELLRDLSDKEESLKLSKPYPRYIPVKCMKKGGEALLVKSVDRWRDAVVMLKIPLPIFAHDAEKMRRDAAKRVAEESKPEPARILRGKEKLLEVAKRLYRPLSPSKKLPKAQPLESRSNEEIGIEADRRQKLAQCTAYERFRRSFLIQEQLHRKANRTDPQRRYGYIPKTYEFGFEPRCYFSQEFIPGQSLLEWCRGHSDEENFGLFLKLTIFVEKVLHDYGVAHCDLAPRNVMVIDGVPVVIDFGIAKTPHLEEITLASAQLGSIAYSDPEQLQDSAGRSFQGDVFSLGRILWVVCARREPQLDGIIVSIDDEGKVDFDERSVSSLFDPSAMPDRLRGVFGLTQAKTYSDISEFRADLESMYFQEGKTEIYGCRAPCRELLRLYGIMREFFEEGKKP